MADDEYDKDYVQSDSETGASDHELTDGEYAVIAEGELDSDSDDDDKGEIGHVPDYDDEPRPSNRNRMTPRNQERAARNQERVMPRSYPWTSEKEERV